MQAVMASHAGCKPIEPIGMAYIMRNQHATLDWPHRVDDREACEVLVRLQLQCEEGQQPVARGRCLVTQAHTLVTPPRRHVTR
jgi:hypothetical protein